MSQQLLGNDFADHTIKGKNLETRIQTNRISFVPFLSQIHGYTFKSGATVSVSVASTPYWSICDGQGFIWVSHSGNALVKKISIDTNAIVATVDMGTVGMTNCYEMATDGTYIFMNSKDASKWYVSRIRLSDNQASQFGKIASSGFTGLEYCNGNLFWVDAGNSRVYKYSTAGVLLGTTIISTPSQLGRTTSDGLFVWVADLYNGGANLATLHAINSSTGSYNEVFQSSVSGDEMGYIAFAGDSIWGTGGSRIRRLTYVESSGTIDGFGGPSNFVGKTNITTGTLTGPICFAGKYMFVSTTTANTVLRIDATTYEIVETISGFSNAGGIAFDGNFIWVPNTGSSTITKILV